MKKLYVNPQCEQVNLNLSDRVLDNTNICDWSKDNSTKMDKSGSSDFRTSASEREVGKAGGFWESNFPWSD